MVTRRRLLWLGSGLALLPLTGHAARTQVLGIQRRAVGDITVTALLDGYVELDPDALLANIEDDAVSRLLERAYLDAGPVATAINAYVLETPTGTILVDGGAGDAFGPTAGDLPAALEAAGIAPADIDLVFCTHLHPDHVGAFTRDGEARFASAELILHEAERAFWSDESNFAGADEQTRSFAQLAQAALDAYGDRTRTVQDKAEIAPGLTARHLPGHTPGHTGVLVQSAGETLLLWGDIVHIGPIQFARPDVTIAFDVDPPTAAATRRTLLDEVATDRLLVAGAHVSFPSFGHVERRGDGYGFAPARWPYEL